MNSTLLFIRYASLLNWSARQHLPSHFGYCDRYPLVAIGEFLKQTRNETIVSDNVEYKQITVRTQGGGICLRCSKKGKDIGTKKQWIAHAGQFLLSKIDARNGAMGIVPKELDGAIVTHDFPLFDINSQRINSQFLVLIITTELFLRFARSCSSGTTNRQRIDITQFLAQRIPLPSLEEQNMIVRRYMETISAANDYEHAGVNSHVLINSHLKSILGLSIKKKEVRRGLNFISFRDVSRWDYLFYKTQKKVSALYPMLKFSDCICAFLEDKDGNSLRCSTSDHPNEEFVYIGMEHIEKETGVLLENVVVKGQQIKSQTNMVPKGFLLFGKLRPYLNKYWINTTEQTNIVCSSEFFVFDVNSQIVDKEYFMATMASSFVQEQISDAVSGARMPRINERTFMDILIPVPPLEIQREIVDYVKKQKEDASIKRQQAKLLRQQAIEAFEARIFSNR